MRPPDLQISPDVMMIRPVAFAGNPQTQASNSFQDRDAGAIDAANQAAALREFEALATALDQAGVKIEAARQLVIAEARPESDDPPRHTR